MREAELYPPVKAYLEAQGYAVKGEIGACDVLAVRGDEPPVVVELKTGFTLTLIQQGIDRQGVTDDVYLAVPPFTGRAARGRQRDATNLCRRLGLGLLTVRLGARPFVDVLLDPAAYQPRKRSVRAGRLLREFARRVGDPNAGGAATATGRMTAYRQDALRCARHLAAEGPTKASVVAGATGVPKAATLLLRDVYGWFERVERGIYALTPKGTQALEDYGAAVKALED